MTIDIRYFLFNRKNENISSITLSIGNHNSEELQLLYLNNDF